MEWPSVEIGIGWEMGTDCSRIKVFLSQMEIDSVNGSGSETDWTEDENHVQLHIDEEHEHQHNNVQAVDIFGFYEWKFDIVI